MAIVRHLSWCSATPQRIRDGQPFIKSFGFGFRQLHLPRKAQKRLLAFPSSTVRDESVAAFGSEGQFQAKWGHQKAMICGCPIRCHVWVRFVAWNTGADGPIFFMLLFRISSIPFFSHCSKSAKRRPAVKPGHGERRPIAGFSDLVDHHLRVCPILDEKHFLELWLIPTAK